MVDNNGRVQSLTRAFDLLEHLADAGGSATLSQLAATSGLPLPTIHRLMRSLVGTGYVRQEASRRYALGPRLIRLGESASQMLGSWAMPYLADLVDRIGETANGAILEGDSVVYVAQVPSPHSVRMFTEVGRRVLPHSTGVGKALLSTLADDDVLALVKRTGMPAQTTKTITRPDRLLAELRTIRARGYAVDEGEQEVGVRCVAVPVVDAPVRAAISVSGPDSRVTLDRVHEIAPILLAASEALVADLRREPA
jgi:IclR family transcriptional regulator, acetate operon repressor